MFEFSSATLRLVLASGLIAAAAGGEAQETSATAAASRASTSSLQASYPDLCVVSDEKLGSMGAAHTVQHNGRTVKFCCKACVAEFDKDPEKYLRKLDEAVISEQGKNYPLTACVVTGNEMAADGGKNIVVDNQLVRICCGGCEAQVRAEPGKFLDKVREGREKKSL